MLTSRAVKTSWRRGVVVVVEEEKDAEIERTRGLKYAPGHSVAARSEST